MSKVDDELTRRLHRAERPVETDVFERLERRRSHRERVRRVQTAVLAVTVLAATAGGFAALSRAFRETPEGIPGSPEPSSVPGVAEGTDIGLGFHLCQAERLGGIDFLGDGTRGTAWIGVPTDADGTCPRHARPGRYVVAEDHTGDGVADSWLDLPWRCDVDCVPFDATDLDGNGTDELVVASYFSIMDYYVMGLKPEANGNLRIAPLLVAEPGHAPADLIAGEPLRIDAGGDAGYGSSIWCDNYPSDPVIVWAWVLGVVDGNQPSEVHITRLKLQSDGLVHVVGSNDYTISATENWGYGNRTEPACGVDFHPNA